MSDESAAPPPAGSSPGGASGGGGQGSGPGGAPGQGSGLDENVAGALAYLLGPVTGILFLILDKPRPFVRFHAVQCLVVTVAWVALSLAFTVLATVAGVIPVLGWMLGSLAYMVLSLGGFILWLILMYRAFQGEEWEVPLLGEYARRFEARV